jgi:hypothetical protein
LDIKAKAGGIAPTRNKFLELAKIDIRALNRIFGANAFSKLQQGAGDEPNRWSKERTPTRVIMEQYAALVVEVGNLPPYAEWDQRSMRPTESGLKKSHNIKWSEMPSRFVEWAKTEGGEGFEDALDIISSTSLPPTNITTPADSRDVALNKLLKDVKEWLPNRRRNVEETYKVELRKYLESKGYSLSEETGDSLCDLVVNKRFSIELKKDPDTSDYDRLFGQVARHLEHFKIVLAVICDARRGDRHDLFLSLVDKFLNVPPHVVEVIRI